MRKPVGWLLAMGSATAFVVGAGVSARADTMTPVDLTPYYNGSWSSEINGPAVQAGAESGTGNTGSGLTFSDPTGQYVEVPDNGVSQTILFSPIALTGNPLVDTLMNQFYGAPAGSTAATVQFTNSLGQDVTFSLTSGNTIRDYNNDGYVNVLGGSDTGVTAQPWWTTGDAGTNGNGEPSQRLDAQTFVLPSSWDGTSLISMVIQDPNGSGGDDVLSAITVDDQTPVSTTPLPAALPLFAGGLGLLGFVGRRKKRQAQAAA